MKYSLITILFALLLLPACREQKAPHAPEPETTAPPVSNAQDSETDVWERELESLMTSAEDTQSRERFDAQLADIQSMLEKAPAQVDTRLYDVRVRELMALFEQRAKVLAIAEDLVVEVQAMQTGAGARVTGTLTNRGEVPVMGVSLGIDFLDAEGERVHRFPVEIATKKPLAVGERTDFSVEVPSLPPTFGGQISHRILAAQQQP